MRFLQRLILVSLLLVIWISISSASVLARLSGAQPEACAFWRIVFSIPILYVMSRLNQENKPNLTTLTYYHVVSGVSLALHFILWFHSVFLIPVYTSTLLVTLYPLYSLVIEAIFLSRKPSPVQLLGLFLSVFLLAVYLRVSQLGLSIGVIYALLGGIFASIYFTTGYYARSKLGESTLDYALRVYTVAALTIGLYGLLTGVNMYSYGLLTYVFLILMAFLPMMLGHTLMNYLLGKYPASLITSVSFGEPFGAALLAHILLKETLSAEQVILGLLIVITVITTIVKTQR